ncbi:MAG: hypothetical protein ACYC3L_10710 [Gemmatimonadaceae bacterium]
MIVPWPPMPGCIHIPGSAYDCPGRGQTLAIIPPDQIMGGTISLVLPDSTRTFRLPNGPVDALFLTKSSLTILVEHYQAIGDTVKAGELKAYQDQLP